MCDGDYMLIDSAMYKVDYNSQDMNSVIPGPQALYQEELENRSFNIGAYQISRACLGEFRQTCSEIDNSRCSSFRTRKTTASRVVKNTLEIAKFFKGVKHIWNFFLYIIGRLLLAMGLASGCGCDDEPDDAADHDNDGNNSNEYDESSQLRSTTVKIANSNREEVSRSHFNDGNR